MKRNNHYVAQSYLKHWTNNEGKLWRYNILVSHHSVPEWKMASPKAVAYFRNLYTQVIADDEMDELEQWFDHEYENPATIPISKAIAGARLSPNDWTAIIRYVAMQCVRTPAKLTEHIKRSQKELPELMEKVLKEAKIKLENGELTEVPPSFNRQTKNKRFPVKVVTKESNDPDTVYLGVRSSIGRASWIHSMHYLLENTAKILLTHKWSIMRPSKGMVWPTSDNPVVLLNYYDDGKYDFKGGWGNAGSEIILPISPEHILYTKVGAKPPKKGTRFDARTSLMIKKFIVESAHRMIFSIEPDTDISKIRKRHVSLEDYKYEQDQWRKWHKEQSEVEKEFFS